MTSLHSASPKPALEHLGFNRRRGVDAVTMLTVYIVLLLAIPSNVAIGALGSIGRPSMLWGLVLLIWWMIARFQSSSAPVGQVSQPVRLAFCALLIVALVSFAAAMMRGQPADQVSPATTSILRLLSWGGVLLVAIDGVRTVDALTRLVRRLAIAGGLLAALGLVQFVTGHTIVDVYGNIPGLSASAGGVDARGAFTRASGTASHPLEYASALSAILPLAIVTAVSGGFRSGSARHPLLWWVPVGLITISSLLAVSRSAIIGFAVALVAMIPTLPRRYRGFVVVGGVLATAAVFVAVPGLLSTMIGLFADAGTDASTTSRTNGLERAPEFISTSPWFGAGFGTFLPRYYIFDNQWVLITVELGVLGALALAGVILSGVWSALYAVRRSGQPDAVLLGRALAVSLVAMGVLLAFFDGLSFPIAGGLLFLIAGLCGAMRTIGEADHRLAVRVQPRGDSD